MTTDFTPGQPVMVLQLPLSLDAMGYVNDFTDRVYGTGNTLMSGRGDQIQISAPREGFGEPLRDPLPPFTRDPDDDINLASLRVVDDRIETTLESAGDALARFAETQKDLLDLMGAVNYVHTDVRIRDEEEPSVHVVVQRKGRPTPHELREAAEMRERALAEALQDATAQLESGNIGNALTLLRAALSRNEQSAQAVTA